jgi:hypothetical protein
VLLRVLFLCFAIAALGETLFQAAGAAALAALHRQSILAAESGFTQSTQSAQSAIASAIAAGSPLPAQIPAPAPTCALSAESGCLLFERSQISLATMTPSPCASGCATFLQQNDAVDEGRAAVSISVSVTNSAGNPVGSRGGTVLFRTLRVAPYALASGTLDSTLDGMAGAGDIGGIAATAASAGTLLEVIYRNAQSGAVMPANVWNALPADAPLASGWSP